MKRIIVCSDGTWNKPGLSRNGVQTRTNVQKIFEAICNSAEDNTKQIKFYDAGIGAEGSLYSKLLDGSTGRGLDENILDCYKFISWNYEQGDEIYLFGFSRGAYTSRSLAGLIYNSGLIKNNDLTLVHKAYEMYRNRDNVDLSPKGSTAIAFRNAHCQPNVRIKFIGVWDTVGALGIPSHIFQWYNEHRYAFHDPVLNSQVDFAYQALAIDENRKNFEPSLWEQNADNIKKNPNQVLEQTWFVGVHSNIGGGYPNAGLSDISLEWMIEKAKATNLSFDNDFVGTQVKGNIYGEMYDARKHIFKLLPPFIRKVKTKENTSENIHASVYQRMAINDPAYNPINIPRDIDSY
jgi:uncharacterized protein (DUF2235 family)